MIIREKKVKSSKVTLEKQGNEYIVKVDADVVCRSPNEIYATQRYMEI